MLIESPPQAPSSLGFPFYSVLFFICFWCLITLLISAISGWMTLARKFRLENEFQGEKWRFRTAYMRFLSHYSNVITIGSDRTGLYMSLFHLFRIGHPPLLIPWPEVTILQGEHFYFFFKTKKFFLGREERIPLRISASLAENLRQAAGPAWPPESPAV